jgi:hypothetical protein
VVINNVVIPRFQNTSLAESDSLVTWSIRFNYTFGVVLGSVSVGLNLRSAHLQSNLTVLVSVNCPFEGL